MAGISVYIGGRGATVLAVAAVAVGVAVIPVVTGGSGGGSCDSTLTTGQSVATALTSVTAGGTVCLGAGSYSFNTTISKSSMTKVTPAAGVAQSAVTFNLIDVNTSNNLWFDGMSVGSGESEVGTSSAGATNIKLTNIHFTGHLCLWSKASNMSILVDSNYFDSLTQGACTGGEGGIGVEGPNSGSNGITISNNEIYHTDGDGIQLVGNSSGTVIGPGNWFHAIQDYGSGAHADAIQPYGSSNITVTGNYIGPDNDGGFSDFDCAGSVGLTFTNNVVQRGSSAQNPVAISGSTSAVITHNTFGSNTPIQLYGGNPGNCTNTGATIKDNVFNGGCNSNATGTINYNVTDVTGCRGANGFNGSGTFTGGTTPSTLAGYLLTSGSLGHLGASDGADVGAPIATMTGAW